MNKSFGLLFYVKRSKMNAEGHARGNALYDAQLDAIFIDEQILNPVEITRMVKTVLACI